jgi:nucleotide-binding universal stress UspA family protein
MFETVVIATDGSESVKRGVTTAVDLTERFDGTVHALYVADSRTVADSPSEIQSDIEGAIQKVGQEALSYVEDQAGDGDVVTAIREGTPAEAIIDYAEEVDADAIAMGTRGRDGEHAFLLGSVAEAVVRHAPMPVLTVRQLEER